MHVHKASDTPAGNITQINLSEKNNNLKTQPDKTAKPQTQGTSPFNARSASSLASTAGLPADRLSASIISFARFFSLPLKPELLASIRRQAFTLPAKIASQQMTQSSSPAASAAAQPPAVKGASSGAETFREALSLAAAAAESKGTELQAKGLEAYAQTFDPDWTDRKDGRGQQNKKQEEKEEEKRQPKTFSVTAAEIEKKALEQAQDDPLLAIMNRLPGKNGQRWIVLPFNFNEGSSVPDGREFNVSLRILLDEHSIAGRAALMAMDIKINNEKKWLFVMESADNKPVKLTVYVPGDAAQNVHSVIKSELSRLLEIEQERVNIKNRDDGGIAGAFLCESECGGMLREIDEAV